MRHLNACCVVWLFVGIWCVDMWICERERVRRERGREGGRRERVRREREGEGGRRERERERVRERERKRETYLVEDDESQIQRLL